MFKVRIMEGDTVLLEQDGGTRLTMVAVVNAPAEGQIGCGVALQGVVDIGGLYAILAAIDEHVGDHTMMLSAIDMLEQYMADKEAGRWQS